MQIRTQAYAIAILGVAAIAMVAATLLVFEGQTRRALARSQFASSIVADGFAGLRLVTTEYFIYRSARTEAQWRQRHATIAGILASDILEGEPEQAILRTMRQRHAYLSEVFARLVAIRERVGAGEASGESWRALEGRLVTQIMLATQDMVVDASRLARRSHESLVEARETASAVVLFLVGLMGAAALANLWFVLRHVVNPLRRLTEGAAAVGAGDLAFRTRLAGANEMSAFSGAFDGMAASLARARAEVEVRNEQLERVNQELESFSYSVSHDLRSPLRGIDGWSLALLEDYGDGLDPKARGYLETVRTEAQRMGRLIDDLLNLSRVGRSEMKLEAVDFSALASRVAARLAESHPGRKLAFDIEPGLVARGDPRLLEIALANLLDNACKFTAPRPVARISVGVADEPAADGAPRERAFFVRDNGVGFDGERARKLFGAFQRFHHASEFPGTGIGLATVKRIIARHGGRIRGQSRPGEGASFHFSLGDKP